MYSKSLSAQHTNFVNLTFITVSESKYKKSLTGIPLLVTKKPWWFCVKSGVDSSLIVSLENRIWQMDSGLSRVWQAWHMRWAPLWQGAKIVWQKSTIKPQSCITIEPSCNAGRAAPAPSSSLSWRNGGVVTQCDSQTL